MIRDPEGFSPTASDWFSPTLEYAGRCKAEFSAPRGSVEGPATVSVDEAGNVSIQMFPERESLQTERPFRLGLIRFFGGDDFARKLGNGASAINLFAQNPCTGLAVTTPAGTFRSTDVFGYGTSSVMNTGDITEANFAVGLSTFETDDAGQPSYWVLPLANFLSECEQKHPELDRHPLRIFPTPEVPEEVTTWLLDQDEEQLKKDEERAFWSLYFANSKNNLIVFRFADGVGFVEHLPDYDESEQLLIEGRERSKTTSVAVGPVGSEPVDTFERMRGWFPFDVLSLLTMATGTEIGCPWVEIRDGRGRLVRRFHGSLEVRPFRQGRRLIREISMTRGGGLKATGRLIERAYSRSEKFGNPFVRIAIIHLVRSQYEGQSLDDSISHLSRGFELLCKRYRTSKERLGLRLTPALRKEVGDILQDTARKIRDLDAATTSLSQRSALDRIQSRTRNADGTDNSFGAAVVKLIKTFWLPDAHILESHYRGRQGGWASLLSEVRGDVTHHGYLPFLEKERDMEELVATMQHLQDTLARIIFKILEFDGGYNTRFLPGPGAYPVDWATPHLSARELGYKKKKTATQL